MYRTSTQTLLGQSPAPRVYFYCSTCCVHYDRKYRSYSTTTCLHVCRLERRLVATEKPFLRQTGDRNTTTWCRYEYLFRLFVGKRTFSLTVDILKKLYCQPLSLSLSNMGARVARMFRNFNLENRVHREISKDKPRAAPRHAVDPPPSAGSSEGE